MYLSPRVIESAKFTPAMSADLRMGCAMLIEKWRRFYPVLNWSMIDYTPTVAVDAGQAKLSGSSTGTRVHDIYREAVAVDNSGNYAQPHGASAIPAPSRLVYKPAMAVHAYFRRAAPDHRLTPTGENNELFGDIVIPTALADECGLTISAGDKFTFGGQTYEIENAFVPERGYWKTTNVPLYIAANVTNEAIGS